MASRAKGFYVLTRFPRLSQLRTRPPSGVRVVGENHIQISRTPQRKRWRGGPEIAQAELVICRRTYALAETPAANFLAHLVGAALAFVRDEEVRSALVPWTSPLRSHVWASVKPGPAPALPVTVPPFMTWALRVPFTPDRRRRSLLPSPERLSAKRRGKCSLRWRGACRSNTATWGIRQNRSTRRPHRSRQCCPSRS